MGRHVGPLDTIRVTFAEPIPIAKGQFVEIEGFFGMAVQEVVPAMPPVPVDLVLSIAPGEYETSQIVQGDAFLKGDKVYWNAGLGLLTTQANPDANGNPQNRPVGRVTKEKGADGVIWFQLAPQADLAH